MFLNLFSPAPPALHLGWVFFLVSKEYYESEVLGADAIPDRSLRPVRNGLAGSLWMPLEWQSKNAA
jgi:hypothetical protein